MPNYRQEVFNVLLAQLLQERGIASAPESVVRAGPTRERRMPDVVVTFDGLRTAIEGEVDDQPDCEERAAASARSRVTEGIAHIGVAVVYPSELRQVPFPKLKPALAASRLRLSVMTESEEPTAQFAEASLDDLGNALRRTFDQLVKEDAVSQAASLIEVGIEQFADAMVAHHAELDRLGKALDIHEVSLDDEERKEGPKQAKFSFARRSAIGRIAGLVLENAFIFQDMLSGRDQRVNPLRRIAGEKDFLTRFADHWQFIKDEIDYYPVLHVAQEILLNLSSNPDVAQAITKLITIAQEIVQMRAALRHDLMGRVYHRLLGKSSKYLGTCYTSIPAATLLLKLALRPQGWPTDWGDVARIAEFKIADLASGTGTLLMAAADSLTDNYIGALTANPEKDMNMPELQKVIVENVLHGYDVLLSAVHLTASTLAMRAPGSEFRNFNLYCLPLGGKDLRLGSIEYLTGNVVPIYSNLFERSDEPAKATGKGMKWGGAKLPPLQLCVMNPPFTRSAGENLLFGSLPEAERVKLQSKLQTILHKNHAPASATAGLGSVFVAAANPHIEAGGRIALVLPKSVISGISWGPTRDLLRAQYQVEYVVASHDPGRWNFSENTELSEVLLVARKKTGPADSGDGRVSVLNLLRNPSTAVEALAIAHSLQRHEPPGVEERQGAMSVCIGDEKVGEAMSVSWQEFTKEESWMLYSAFAQPDLTRTARQLARGKLQLPGRPRGRNITLCQLRALGTLGPDRRDIHDGFELSETVTPYAAVWGHDADSLTTIALKPNMYLSPLARAKKGRGLRKADDLWPLAGNILLAERLWLNTQRVVAMRTPQPVLSNVWWPLSLRRRTAAGRPDKALALWLNSTLGLLMLLAHRDETRGAWVDFKKPTLGAMPVLNTAKLSAAQLKKLAACYDRVSEQPLRPLPEMNADGVRAEIDGTIAKVLHLPDFSILRKLLSQEPVVCLKRLGASDVRD